MLLKLLQKSDVVFEHQANVVEFVHQRAHSFQPEAEGKARKDLRVNIAGF